MQHLPRDAQLAIYSYATHSDLRTYASLWCTSSTTHFDESPNHATGLRRDAACGHLNSLGVYNLDTVPVQTLVDGCRVVVADERRLRKLGFPRLWSWIEGK